jgi:hypothetical protein
MEITDKPGVYKLKFKKIKQLYGVKIPNDLIQKQGTTWQGFNPCDLVGNIEEKRRHYCCIYCGYYIRGVDPRNTASIDKLPWDRHPKTCNGDKTEENSQSNNDDDTSSFPKSKEQIIPFITKKLVKFICSSNLSLVQGASFSLKDLIHNCMRLARVFETLPLDRIFPEWSRYTLSRKINEIGEKQTNKDLRIFVGKNVCIIWDAGKGLNIPFFFSFFSFRWRPEVCGDFDMLSVWEH